MYIVSIAIERREKTVPKVQEILTEYGDDIHSRIGLHKVQEDERDFIIVMYTGKNIEEFVHALKDNNNTSVNYMKA